MKMPVAVTTEAIASTACQIIGCSFAAKRLSLGFADTWIEILFRQSSVGRLISAQAESICRFAHGGYAEGDVLLDRDGQLCGAVADVFAIHASGECFVLQLALYG